MTRLRKTVRIRGLTLVELAIASFLFLLVLGLTSAALSSGVKSYLSVRSEVELQQDALAILSRITREVGEADPGTTWPPPTADTTLIPPGPDPVGIVFSSPRDGSGLVGSGRPGEVGGGRGGPARGCAPQDEQDGGGGEEREAGWRAPRRRERCGGEGDVGEESLHSWEGGVGDQK